VACGRPKLDPEIARNAADVVRLETHRTLSPALRDLRSAGYRLVGLEQTTGSVCLYDYRFTRRTALVVGNERQGLEEDVLALLDDAVEIPVYGMPYSYNVSSATDMALYEYCRQFPTG
jgi:tRNA G18 (ribose-2'-O)-methylase SpoU